MSEQNATTLITVVIPYFQREPGLLSAAIKSIADQNVKTDVSVHIIIVDDGSPSPAASEVISPLPDFISLQVLVQDNRGVAAARNAGLDAVPRETGFVAFLDSDDVWLPTHLSSALSALQPTAPLYFDDTQMDADKTAFQYSEFLSRFKEDSVSEELFHLKQQEILAAFVEGCVFHTSQVVYDYSRFSALRFDPDLTFSGEDHIFFLKLILKVESVVFSTKVNGCRGSGVSLFRETLNWDSPNILPRLTDEIAVRLKIAKLPLTPPQLAINALALKSTKRKYVFLTLHRLIKHNIVGLFQSLRKILRLEPRFLLEAPILVFEVSRAREELLTGRG